jgi:hypothetical protein
MPTASEIRTIRRYFDKRSVRVKYGAAEIDAYGRTLGRLLIALAASVVVTTLFAPAVLVMIAVLVWMIVVAVQEIRRRRVIDHVTRSSHSRRPAVLGLKTLMQSSPLADPLPIPQRTTPVDHLADLGETVMQGFEGGEYGDDFSEHEKPRFYAVDSNLVNLSDCGRLSVVGESFYQEALHTVAGGRAFGYDFDEHYPVTVVLFPEPENPHDTNAVRIDVLQRDRSLKVGYLSREVAKAYQPILLELRKKGSLGTCPGHVTGGGQKYYGIYLHLAPPDLLFSDVPAGPDLSFFKVGESEVVFKAEWACTVTREEDHQDVLTEYNPIRDGELTPIVATLGFCEINKGKYIGDRAIEVSIGGKRVGELTRSMTDRYAELIDVVHRRGLTATCEGFVTRDPRRGLQVELAMPKDPARPSLAGVAQRLTSEL